MNDSIFLTDPQNTLPKVLKSSKTPKEIRRQEMIEIAKKIGLWNINQTEFSKKYGVSQRMIGKDLRWVIGHMRLTKIREIQIEIDIASKNAINEAIKIMYTATDPKIKLNAINTLMNATTKYTEFLEAYGMKQKVPEQTNIEDNIFMGNILDKIQKNLERAKIITKKEETTQE